jgi:MFS family permease
MAGEGSPRWTLLAVYAALAAFFAALAARGFLVPLIAHEMGADRATVGLLFTLSTLAGAIVSIPAGLLADRFGRREIVVVSAIILGLSQLAIAVASDVRLDLALQFAGGCGAGAAQAALYAIVVDRAPANQVGRAMGWMTLALQVGFLSGPAIAGVLAPFLSLRADLVATTALTIVPIALSFLFGGGRRRPAGENMLATLHDVVTSPAFVPIALGLFAGTILWGTTQAYLPLFGKEQLGLPAAYIGYMLTIQAVANGASRVPGGRIVDRVPTKGWIVAGGTIGYALAVLVLPHATGFWLPTLVLVVGVPFMATAFVALAVSFSSLGTSAGRGTAMGFYGAVLFSGLAAGPAIFGAVMQRSGYVVGFSSCAVAAIAVAGLMLLTRARELRMRTPEVILPPPA